MPSPSAGSASAGRANAAAAAPRIIADDGFYFGLGAFETVAVEDGVPLLLSEHLDRMTGTLKRLGIPREHAELADAARRALEYAELRGPLALKITATKDNLLCSLRPNAYTAQRIESGFTCAVSTVRRNETSPLTQMKTLNYGDCIMQKRAANAAGVDEPLFLNTHGQVAEGATTNVFAVIHNQLVTPPVDAGLLPGVMRAWIIEAARARERTLALDELLAADEVLLTNSLMGAMPVTAITAPDGTTHRFPAHGRATELADAWRNHVQNAITAWKETQDPWARI